MYLLLHWMGLGYLILDKNTMYLGNQVFQSVPDAIKGFTDAWYIGDRDDRFSITDTALVDIDPYRRCSHPILATFESLDLDYLQQHYPELLI